MVIKNLKRTSDQISSNNENESLDLAKKIFLHHYLQIYSDMNICLNQIEPLQEGVETPHFVSDNGIIIYIQLMQDNKYLYEIKEDDIHLAMEILKIKVTKLFTITLISESEPIESCYSSITEKIYRYSAVTSKKLFAGLPPAGANKRRKVTDSFVLNEWVSASKTRNYCLHDTLVDWLSYWYDSSPEKQSFTPHHTYNEFNFLNYIMNKGKSFEENVIGLIKQKVNPSEFVTICQNMDKFSEKVLEYESRTIEEIQKGTPIIYQGLLLNRTGNLSQSYGSPDLIVRSDYLSKIVDLNPLTKTQELFKAPKLTGQYHYVIIDIKFTTLELCNDGLRIRNSGSVPAYKTQLYIYNHALGLIQGYEPTAAYILGRKYKYENKGRHYYGNSCFARLGQIQYDNWDKDHIITSRNAVQWIKKLRTTGNEWKLLPEPSVPELYPNMASASDTPWDGFKHEYARKIGEITLLWNCGYKNREIAHKNGIYSFNDPKCNSAAVGINGNIQAPLLNKIIKINQKKEFKTPLDRIDMFINTKVNNDWLKPCKLRISVDFETINNIFDDFSKLPESQDQSYLFLIGVSYKIDGNPVQYKMFLASELSKNSEFQMIYQFYSFLRNLTDTYLGKGIPIPPLYHWAHIEKSFFLGLCDRLIQTIGPDVYDDIYRIKNELIWFDLLDCFKNNPIIINGCFKFGLKEISRRLSELGLIKTIWNSNSKCLSDSTTMVIAQKAYQTSMQTGIAINQIQVIKEIMEYNKVDCIVLQEIIDILKEKNNTIKN